MKKTTKDYLNDLINEFEKGQTLTREEKKRLELLRKNLDEEVDKRIL